MPTYRVHLRCATNTNPAHWDWSQIVTADNRDIATRSAYLAWLKVAVAIWVPRFSDCQSMVEEIGSDDPADTKPLILG
jgi:hypothetical protein